MVQCYFECEECIIPFDSILFIDKRIVMGRMRVVLLFNEVVKLDVKLVPRFWDTYKEWLKSGGTDQ